MRASRTSSRWTIPPGPGSRSSRRPRGPGTLQSVAHLHRRAGFAAPWAVLKRDLPRRARSQHRTALEGRSQERRRHAGRRARIDPRRDGGRARAIGRPGADPGDLAVPDDLHAASAPRADDPVLAQPLRHLRRQGPEPGPDAAPERPCSARRRWAISAPWYPRSARIRPC